MIRAPTIADHFKLILPFVFLVVTIFVGAFWATVSPTARSGWLSLGSPTAHRTGVGAFKDGKVWAGSAWVPCENIFSFTDAQTGVTHYRGSAYDGLATAPETLAFIVLDSAGRELLGTACTEGGK